mmetsp:Transcript_38739/g.70336  ORF Transcript_38739/g.70336 Transcript_38739/m.70336 type:complete len:476 (-) Transcript_38739:105-1532(-)
MPDVQPATFEGRAGIVGHSLEFQPSWVSVPFDSYEGMTQQQFQDATAPFLNHGKQVPLDVPKGWRRVEGSHPGKQFYVHVATGTMSKSATDLFNCREECWMTKDGLPIDQEDVLLSPHLQILQTAYPQVDSSSSSSSKRRQDVEAPRSSPQPQQLASAVLPTGPALPVGLLFPGQGSQYVKMLEGVKDLPAVKEMLETAKRILEFDILDLCLNGPESRLEQTKFCQPAMYIAGLAAVEKLRLEHPDKLERCQAVAGLSLGEYTALTVAGVMDFETGLKVVKLRAEAMQEAAGASEQCMMSVAGLSQEKLAVLCQESCEAPGDVCEIANCLFPNGFSCAGSAKAVERLMAKAQQTEGCLQAKLLKTSGGFHTRLMAPARERLLAALRDAEPHMRPPRCDVYLNVTGKRIAPGTQPSELIQLMGDQLCSCVLWEPAVRAMIADGVTEFYECGPMKQLKAMMKRIDAEAFKNTNTVDV